MPELLALFPNTGRPGMTSVDVARDRLVRFESIRGVLSTTATQLRRFGGIGPAKATLLRAASELCQRSLAEKTRERPLLDAPQAVEDYLKWLIGTRANEAFVTLYLDLKHCLISVDESAKRSLSRGAVYPRQIVRRALTLNAASLIAAHNHPSGGVERERKQPPPEARVARLARADRRATARSSGSGIERDIFFFATRMDAGLTFCLVSKLTRVSRV
jgi:DNA repair protein RadC